MDREHSNLSPDATCVPKMLGDVVVLGLGVSGRACVEYLTGPARERWTTLTLYGGTRDESGLAWARRVSDVGGRVIFNDETVTGTYDLAIVSPGIPQVSPFYQSAKAASRELIGELEFAWRESQAHSRWVAITGTNGKTTTTTLTTAVLRRAGYNAASVGNIGEAAITAIQDRTVDVFVAEVSSFQLASTVRFAPDAAVLLNITPDHLAWHGGMESYAAAKAELFAHLADRTSAVAIVNATDEGARALVRKFKADPDRGFAYIPLGAAAGLGADMRDVCGSVNAAYVNEAGDFVIAYNGRETVIDRSAGFALKGTHNLVNALAAATVGVVLGASASATAAALAEARPLAHRIEPAGEVAGVAFYNDSKATNVDSTLTALTAFKGQRPILLLGGRDKGTDLTPLVAACQDACKAVICFGEARARMLEAFSNGAAGPSLSVYEAATLADAFARSRKIAEPGDAVVLSPACASYDEFTNFEERGDAFKAMVVAAGEVS